MATIAASPTQNMSKYDSQADAWALLALKDATLAPPKPVNGNHQISKTPIAKISGKEFEYLVRQSKTIIGRNSSTQGEVDINLGNSSFISRAHVEIHYEQLEFLLKCNGKNGIFAFFILNNLVQHFPMKIAKGIIQEMTTTKFSGIQMRAGLM